LGELKQIIDHIEEMTKIMVDQWFCPPNGGDRNRKKTRAVDAVASGSDI
jgi:hypothetical protein